MYETKILKAGLTKFEHLLNVKNNDERSLTSEPRKGNIERDKIMAKVKIEWWNYSLNRFSMREIFL